MDKNINQNKIKAIADHYGIENQLKKSREELRELREEIGNYLSDYQAEDSEITTIPLIDEIADAKIMIAQLEYLLELEEEVNGRVEFKLDRQIDRIKLEKERLAIK